MFPALSYAGSDSYFSISSDRAAWTQRLPSHMISAIRWLSVSVTASTWGFVMPRTYVGSHRFPAVAVCGDILHILMWRSHYSGRG